MNVYNETYELLYSFRAHSSSINRIRLLATNIVATASSDTKVKIWNTSRISNWTLIQTYAGHNMSVFGLEYINSDTIASGSYDNTTQIWSLKTGLTRLTINTNAYVYALQLLSNGNLAVGLSSGNINIYDINTGNLM